MRREPSDRFRGRDGARRDVMASSEMDALADTVSWWQRMMAKDGGKTRAQKLSHNHMPCIKRCVRYQGSGQGVTWAWAPPFPPFKKKNLASSELDSRE